VFRVPRLKISANQRAIKLREANDGRRPNDVPNEVRYKLREANDSAANDPPSSSFRQAEQPAGR